VVATTVGAVVTPTNVPPDEYDLPDGDHHDDPPTPTGPPSLMALANANHARTIAARSARARQLLAARQLLDRMEGRR
jgi:hypothetical protein